jgi:CO/xanthine dehydrogenase Mo-binding subunit
MTEILSKEFSRTAFLKGGGAMVVGFSIFGAGFANRARGAESPYASHGGYDPTAVDSFIVIHPDNTATIRTGRPELGSGVATGLLMIAGEELNMGMTQLRFVQPDTRDAPNTGAVAGSNGTTNAGQMVRAAAVAAYQALLDLGAARLGVPKTSLTVSDGIIVGGGRSVSYGDLLGDKLFNVRMATTSLQPGAGASKPRSAYKLVTTRVPRLDIPDKASGKYTYIHNVRVPGMLHGRVVVPPGQAAFGHVDTIVSIDRSSIKHLKDVQIVRRDNFLGVVAPREYDAIQAAAQLKVTWADPPPLPGVGNIWKQMRDHDSAGQSTQRYQVNVGNVDPAYAAAAKKVSATFKYHYNGHVPIGPSCAIADVTNNGALIIANPQGAHDMRTRIAAMLGLPEQVVRIKFFEGASTFGSAPYRECMYQAALLSQAVGKPVRLQYMRWNEHGYDNYGPAQLMDVRGAVDANGKIVAYDYTVFAIPYYTTHYPLLQIGETSAPPGLGNADTNNSGTQYNLANRRVLSKSLPLLNNYFKSITLRAPLAPATVFGSEQMVDELAHLSGMDPVAFRLNNISTATDRRWLGTLETVARISGWQPRVAASSLANGTVVSGRGVALGGYAGSMAGVVADIDVNRKTGKIVVKHLYASQDNGFTVMPTGVENQMSGSLIQGASRALYEAVVFDRKRVTSTDWVTYPIMRFQDTPKVTTAVVQRLELNPSGAGEPPTVPAGAAIANAFFDATGVRIREAPMTPGRVRAVLAAAGK